MKFVVPKTLRVQRQAIKNKNACHFYLSFNLHEFLIFLKSHYKAHSKISFILLYKSQI